MDKAEQILEAIYRLDSASHWLKELTENEQDSYIREKLESAYVESINQSCKLRLVLIALDDTNES